MEINNWLAVTSLSYGLVIVIATTDAQQSHDHHVDQQPNVEAQQGTSLSHDSGHRSYLHFDSTTTLLFKDWTTASWTMLTVACVVVAIVSALYEFLQIAVGRLQVITCNVAHVTSSPAIRPSNTSSLTLHSTESSTKKSLRPTRSLALLLLLQTLLHVVRVAIGYGLMLVVMSFNAPVYLAVLLGAAIGHLGAAWTDLSLQAASRTNDCHVATPSGEPQPLKMTYQTCH